MALSPKESGQLIADNACDVKIKTEGIEKLGNVLVEEMNSGHLQPSIFTQDEMQPNPDDSYAIDWFCVVNTLNFCFWHNDNEEGWKVDGHTGGYALCAAINRAIKEKVDILNPKFYSIITEEQLENVLRSDTKVKISLLSERVKCLHEVGRVLLDHFGGTFENVIKKSENSAKKLLALIVDNFKCFKDEATFKGHKVCFYKRAQILIGDIWACFNGKGIGHFIDLDEITMFADYRVPQTLLWYGVFEYSPVLLEKLQQNVIFKNGDVEEIEIRGCSIHAIELLKEFVNKKLGVNTLNSILIDYFLWNFRRKHAQEILEKGLPFHKVYSIYY